MKIRPLLWQALVFSAILCAVSASSAGHVVHEKRESPSGLHQGIRVDSTAIVTFRIALKQRNLERAHDYLLDISHPTSPHYGKLWSAEDVQRAFAPSKETVETVHSWLTSKGIDHVTEHRGWLSFESTVGYIEDVLNAEYYEHEDDEDEFVRIGCEKYHLPNHISKHVDFISPGVVLSVPLEKRSLTKRRPPSLSDPHPRWPHRDSNTNSLKHQKFHESRFNQDSRQHTPSRRSAALPPDLRNCGHRTTAACVRALYNLPSPDEVASSYKANPVNSLGLFEQRFSWNQSDLDRFFRIYAPEIPAGTHPIQDPIDTHRVSHGEHAGFTNPETNLDLMVAYPVIYPQTIKIYQTAAKLFGRPTPEVWGFHYALQEFLDALDGSFCNQNAIPNSTNKDCGTYSAARVISISYGVSEIVQPQLYLQRQCNEFLKLGLQGTTFAAASGDDGVSTGPRFNYRTGILTNGCIVPGNYHATRSQRHGENGTVFSGIFPQTCPYVLSVGGTQIKPDETILDPESSMDFPHFFHNYTKEDFTFTSAGGFSNYFSRPSYQNAAVESYFSKHDPGYPYYTSNGLNLSQPGNNIGAGGGLYNRAGRGFPDVSAIGQHVPTFYNGEYDNSGGTSASTPLWGSIFTLINEKRLQAGKGPVGFVNPVLYEHPEVFTDITRGRNPGCFTKGFAAVPGWDPITGLGTPNYPKVLDLFMSLP